MYSQRYHRQSNIQFDVTYYEWVDENIPKLKNNTICSDDKKKTQPNTPLLKFVKKTFFFIRYLFRKNSNACVL